MYSDIYGFSCIENQVLAILNERKQKIEWTYHDCAVPIHELYSIMVNQGTKQENFNYIQRVQDILRALGVISFIMENSGSMDDFIDEIKACNENEYILIRVKPEFTIGTLHARGFRSDHYVLVKPSEVGFDIYNDIPACIVSVDRQQLSNAFDGSYIKLRVIRTLNTQDGDVLWKTRRYKPECWTIAAYDETDIGNIDEIGIKLRNLAGVNKTLKRRMAQYYGIYTDTRFIYQRLAELDRLYASAEYYVLKRNTQTKKWLSILNTLYSIDTEIFTQLKNALGGIDYARANKQYFDGNGILR